MRPAVLLALVVLPLAAGALLWVSLTAGERTYVAPTPEEVRAAVPPPTSLSGAVPAGHVVRTFTVEGMCCASCSGKLHRTLQLQPGVVEAAVSFEEGLASAVVPADRDPAELAAALCYEKYTATPRP